MMPGPERAHRQPTEPIPVDALGRRGHDLVAARLGLGPRRRRCTPHSRSMVRWGSPLPLSRWTNPGPPGQELLQCTVLKLLRRRDRGRESIRAPAASGTTVLRTTQYRGGRSACRRHLVRGRRAGSPDELKSLTGPDAARVRTLEFPIGFLGNPFVAISTLPAWLGVIALWNPLSSTVSAARQLFGDPIGAHPSWITNHAVLMAVAWPLLLITVFVPLSLHRYRRLSH